MDYKKQKLLPTQRAMAWRQCVFWLILIFWCSSLLTHSCTPLSLSLSLSLCLGSCFLFFQVPASLFNRVMNEFANSNKTLWIFKMSKADDQQKLTKGGKKRWHILWEKKNRRERERAWIRRLQITKDREIFVLTATTLWIFVSEDFL